MMQKAWVVALLLAAMALAGCTNVAEQDPDRVDFYRDSNRAGGETDGGDAQPVDDAPEENTESEDADESSNDSGAGDDGDDAQPVDDAPEENTESEDADESSNDSGAGDDGDDAQPDDGESMEDESNEGEGSDDAADDGDEGEGEADEGDNESPADEPPAEEPAPAAPAGETHTCSVLIGAVVVSGNTPLGGLGGCSLVVTDSPKLVTATEIPGGCNIQVDLDGDGFADEEVSVGSSYGPGSYVSFCDPTAILVDVSITLADA